jgi:hypothetical protein
VDGHRAAPQEREPEQRPDDLSEGGAQRAAGLERHDRGRAERVGGQHARAAAEQQREPGFVPSCHHPVAGGVLKLDEARPTRLRGDGHVRRPGKRGELRVRIELAGQVFETPSVGPAANLEVQSAREVEGGKHAGTLVPGAPFTLHSHAEFWQGAGRPHH